MSRRMKLSKMMQDTFSSQYRQFFEGPKIIPTHCEEVTDNDGEIICFMSRLQRRSMLVKLQVAVGDTDSNAIIVDPSNTGDHGTGGVFSVHVPKGKVCQTVNNSIRIGAFLTNHRAII